MFSYRFYNCRYKDHFGAAKKMIYLLFVICLLILNVVVLTTTACLIVKAYKIAKKGRKNLNWQGLTTTILTATVYFISSVPFAVYTVLARYGHEVTNRKELQRSVDVNFTLNTISNFYIYCLTVESFRSFILSRIQSVQKTITSTISSTTVSRGNITSI